jgi:hypothetical protein
MKAALAAGAVVVLLAAAPAALYAYDSSRSEVIAAGVEIAGVDVGGFRSTARALSPSDASRLRSGDRSSSGTEAASSSSPPKRPA